jgi:DeoR family deoxyribose operon repressor
MTYEKKKRLNNIVSLLHQKAEMTVKEIAGLLNVSEMTIRRDLNDLEKERQVKRTHGGARIYNPSHRGGSDYFIGEQMERRVREKNAIGMTAASRIQAHETIILDSGSTMPFIARYLDREMPLTVICNSFQTATELVLKKNVNLVLSGGYFHRDSNVFHSHEGCELIRNIRAEKAFISAAGIDENLGLTTFFYFEAEAKKAIIESSKQIVLAVDSTKFGKVSTSYFTDLDRVNTIITDNGISDRYRKIIDQRGIELVIADSL